MININSRKIFVEIAESIWCDKSLQLAFHDRNAELASEVKKEEADIYMERMASVFWRETFRDSLCMPGNNLVPQLIYKTSRRFIFLKKYSIWDSIVHFMSMGWHTLVTPLLPSSGL